MKRKNTPRPGTKTARKIGCLCPIRKNNEGTGLGFSTYGLVFIIHWGCPVHGGNTKKCMVEDCPDDVHGRGRCSKHYQEYYRKKNPAKVRQWMRNSRKRAKNE